MRTFLRVRASEHGKHLIRLAGPIVNCYLVREDEGLTLVDCGIAGSATAILSAARSIGAPIRRLAITHAHWDHIGSLDELVKALPETELLVGARESRLGAGNFTLDPPEPEGRLRRIVYRRFDSKPDHLLQPGDVVGSLEVVAAPGHTPGQIAFYDHRDRTLICGDAYLTVGKVFVCSEAVLRFPLPALVGTWHAPTAVDTARALRVLGPNRLASGHGPVVENPAAAMDEALDRVSGSRGQTGG
jgi:glyoxylase-like metal-dependent hydrolase (beta-lactamase superfamily II)